MTNKQLIKSYPKDVQDVFYERLYDETVDFLVQCYIQYAPADSIQDRLNECKDD